MFYNYIKLLFVFEMTVLCNFNEKILWEMSANGCIATDENEQFIKNCKQALNDDARTFNFHSWRYEYDWYGKLIPIRRQI